MCNIAGYTGNRAAAPILIDMLRREQFIDGGQSTGIATIHQGKLYTAKVLGDVDELLRATDALRFPGTTGIIHSRPTGNLQSHAHPFTSEDGKCALVLNGTLRDVNTPEFYQRSNQIMQGFVDRGFTVKSAYESQSKKSQLALSNGMRYHDSEVYALMIGDMVAKAGGATKERMLDAMTDAISALPADIVVLSVHADLPDTVTVGDVTRPMHAGTVGEETYLATTPLAFPEDIAFSHIVQLPPASICQATPGTFTVTGKQIDGVRVEQIDYRVAHEIYARMEKLLKGQKDNPKSLYDVPCFEAWRDVWSEPLVDCKYAKEGGLLKPYATVLYDALWSFHQKGRLHSVLGERKGKPIVKFWID
ncbi:MAG: hypothetical protein E7585_00850 [Ruminococcaceae bacterium]|nr:hypothetical protein [Oscillospiraceae bacterium]